MMIFRQRKLNTFTRIILYALFLLLLTPDVLRTGKLANYALMAIRGLAGVSSLMLLMLDRRRSVALLCLCAYIVYIGAMTVLRSFSVANLVRYIAIYADIFIMAVFCEYLIKYDTECFLKFLNAVLWVGLLLNAATVFLLPNGLAQMSNEAGQYFAYYLYDYDNRFIVRYIPTLLVIYLYEKNVKRHRRGGVRLAAAIVICFATLVYLKSIASMAAFFILILGYVFLDRIPEKLCRTGTVWLGYLIVAGAMVLAQASPLRDILAERLGKASSLYIRMTMWNLALKEIPHHLLLGTGAMDTTSMRDLFTYAQLHNSLLTTLLWGGIVGLGLYSLYMATIGMGSPAGRDDADRKFYAVLFVVVMIASLFDGIELLANMYLFYALLANVNCVTGLRFGKYLNVGNLTITVKDVSGGAGTDEGNRIEAPKDAEERSQEI